MMLGKAIRNIITAAPGEGGSVRGGNGADNRVASEEAKKEPSAGRRSRGSGDLCTAEEKVLGIDVLGRRLDHLAGMQGGLLAEAEDLRSRAAALAREAASLEGMTRDHEAASRRLEIELSAARDAFSRDVRENLEGSGVIKADKEEEEMNSILESEARHDASDDDAASLVDVGIPIEMGVVTKDDASNATEKHGNMNTPDARKAEGSRSWKKKRRHIRNTKVQRQRKTSVVASARSGTTRDDVSLGWRAVFDQSTGRGRTPLPEFAKIVLAVMLAVLFGCGTLQQGWGASVVAISGGSRGNEPPAAKPTHHSLASRLGVSASRKRNPTIVGI